LCIKITIFDTVYQNVYQTNCTKTSNKYIISRMRAQANKLADLYTSFDLPHFGIKLTRRTSDSFPRSMHTI